MAATIFGFRPTGSLANNSAVLESRTVGATAMKVGDLAKLHTDGTLIIATAGDDIFGVITGPGKMGDAVAAGATVEVNVTPMLTGLMESSTLPVKGVTYDFKGGSGAIELDVASGAQGGFTVLEVNPQGFGFDSYANMARVLMNERVYKG